MKKLILHVGWSKTGTSAIQNALHANRDLLLKGGVLYPLACQFPDHSHHYFALAFNKNIVGVKSRYSAKEALELVNQEFDASGASSLLISSELSPFYFQNQDFKKFSQEFSSIEVVFTVREQVNLLLSLYNQLIKDSNVMYRETIFNLFVRNISWLNFHSSINRWAEVVGKDSIRVVMYSNEIVSSFFKQLSLPIDKSIEVNRPVNKSIPQDILLHVRQRLSRVTTKSEYSLGLKKILNEYEDIKKKYTRVLLISAAEQQSIRDHFKNGNKKMIESYMDEKTSFIIPEAKNIFSYTNQLK